MAKSAGDLIIAARSGDLPGVEECLQSGVDINALDTRKNNALVIAADNSRSGIVRYLVEHGAKTDVRDPQGRTALDIAKNNQEADIIFILEESESLQQPEWSLFSPTKLAHAEGSIVHHRKLTEIFNFESRERLTIVENLRTATETTLPLTSFDELSEALLKKAFARFTQLGGVADESFVLRNIVPLEGKSAGPLRPERK